jgi:hypothetical protein
MIEYENRCCGCATPGYPCLGSACDLRRVPVYYCDGCGIELDEDEIYEVDDDDLCEECLKERFKKCD